MARTRSAMELLSGEPGCKLRRQAAHAVADENQGRVAAADMG